MRIGIADTTFARVDLAAIALEILKTAEVEIERYTVPGFKDLPVAAKRLIEKYNCDLVLAFGWCGKAEIDETCAHEANLGLIQVEIATSTHILKVFVHEREAETKEKLVEIAKDRAQKHTLNALALLKGKEELTQMAGKGLRQGHQHEGEI